MPELTLTRHGSTALLTIKRPPANALNHPVLAELSKLLAQVTAEKARALVITGEGRFFSAGLDLFEVFSYGEAEAEAFATTFDDFFTTLFALPIPVVAAINGHAVAGGAVLAAAADFRLMANNDAQLGLAEIKVGVPFPTSAFEIVRTAWTGPHFSELVYRGRSYKPQEALHRHFIDEVVPAGDLLQHAIALADELGAHPQLAYSSNKRGLRREALARMAAARIGGQDPVWREWRTPEVMAIVENYRASVAKKKSQS